MGQKRRSHDDAHFPRTGYGRRDKVSLSNYKLVVPERPQICSEHELVVDDSGKCYFCKNPPKTEGVVFALDGTPLFRETIN